MTSCFRVSPWSARSQPGALMKSEITNTSERPLIQRRPASSSGPRSVNGADALPRMRLQVVDEPQHLDPPAPRRDRPLDLRPVEDRADLVPVPRQHPGQRRDDVHQHAPLQPLRLHRPEVDRRAQVQQEPRRDLAILEELADVRRVHPRRDVPVDVADVVAVLVLAQVGEIDAVPAEQAPVVALEQAVQPADDRPVEALEDALRRRRGRGHRIAAGRRGRAPDR